MRGKLRLYSALTMLSFVVCHLTAHAAMLVSLEWAGTVHGVLVSPWTSDLGELILLGAALTHYTNALWSIYVRRTLALSRWEAWQLTLGLCIPPLLMAHIAGTAMAEEAFDIHPSYASMLVVTWVLAPLSGWIQASALLTIWTHACIGLRFWLHTKRHYPTWQPWLLGLAVLVPTLAVAGFVAGGNHVLHEVAVPGFTETVLAKAGLSEKIRTAIQDMAWTGVAIHCGLVLLPFLGRLLRHWHARFTQPARLTHSCGRTVPISPGATILEILREHRIGHAAVCGGRGRCTTCRIHVSQGLESLPPPGAAEARALARIKAGPTIRLACQVRPSSDIAIRPLLPPEARPVDGYVPGGLEGSEQPVVVVFVDLRGSTTLGEAKLPYDVLFILNQFFQQMSQALTETGGHYSQFTGDGLMALYGLDEAPPRQSVAAALKGAALMLARLEQLNARLADELPQPLKMGIGIHFGDAIVGRMGPPGSQITSAIGDTVNTTARLEGLTKDHDCPLILSEHAARMAGLALPADRLFSVVVKGRSQAIGFYALGHVPEVLG
jgi:adenylate cyclase